MTKLESMINELCPDGVEFKTLEELCNISSGGDVPKEDFSSDKTDIYNIPIISNGVGKGAFYGYTNIVKISEPAVTVSARGTIGYAEYRDYPYYPIIRLLSVIPNHTNILNTKYLYYLLKKQNYSIPKTGIPQLTSLMIKKIIIPLPPIEIQREIVRILDKYSETVTALQHELEKELELRKKQYEYYRDKLLTFGDDVELKTLREIATLSRGIRVVRKQLEITGNIPVYQNSMIPLGYYKKSNCKSNTTFIIGAGAAGEIGFSAVDFWAADDCYYFICSEKILDKFLYYVLSNKYTFIKSQVRKASIPRLARSVIEKIKIPVPLIEEQERIVKILDKFNSLCNDLTSGLLAEINARKKQYEYYRDKLLTFKEMKV